MEEQDNNDIKELDEMAIIAYDEARNPWTLSLKPQNKYPTRYDLKLNILSTSFVLTTFGKKRDAQSYWDLLINSLTNKGL